MLRPFFDKDLPVLEAERLAMFLSHGAESIFNEFLRVETPPALHLADHGGYHAAYVRQK